MRANKALDGQLWLLLAGAVYMVFTDAAFEWLSLVQFNVRSALARSRSEVPYQYEGELFFKSYEALRVSGRAGSHSVK